MNRIVLVVHGRHYSYEVVDKSGFFPSYGLRRSDGKYLGTYSERGRAIRRAYEEAGPDAREGRPA